MGRFLNAGCQVKGLGTGSHLMGHIKHKFKTYIYCIYIFAIRKYIYIYIYIYMNDNPMALIFHLIKLGNHTKRQVLRFA